MTQYKTFGPDAEVFGAAMMAFVKSINYTNFSQILAHHGLETINPNSWYPQQVWLDVFSDIANRPGFSTDLVSIGMKIVETAVMPPEVQSLPFMDVALSFNQGSYLANNRGKDVGGIEAQVIDPHHVVMIDRTPYPDDFVYGAYYALARRFLPNTTFTVKYDEQIPRREQGGTETRVHIQWS